MTRKIRPLVHFEQLEPRIMLSGDSLLDIVPNPHQDTILADISLTDQYAELLDTHEQIEEQISLEPAPSETSGTDVYQPVFTLYVDDNESNDELADADLSVDNTGLNQTGDVLIVLSNDLEGDIEDKVGTTEDGVMPTYINDADLSIEYATSIEIRGPPVSEAVALYGMHLVESTVDYFERQVVYLDFDGEEDVTYEGPVTIEDIDVPVFIAPGELAGQEDAIIAGVLEELNRIFAGSGIIFTTERPSGNQLYSTIYIGGNDSAFANNGFFLGLAEQVDAGNLDPGDNAFVFSENIVDGYTDLASFATKLTDVIAHETGHLLGYAHIQENPTGGILSTVADTYTSPTGSNHYYDIYITPGTHTFVVDGIFAERYTEWYVNGIYTGDTDHSYWANGFWDPDHSYSFSSGTTYIEANVYDGDWNWLEYHGWNCTIDTTPPTVPSLVSPSDGAETSDTTVYLDWDDSSDSGTGVDYYQVQVDNSSSFSSPEFDATPSSSNDTTDSLSDGYYYWHVRARDNAGNWSSWSSYRTFLVDTTAPSTPVLSSPANGSSTSDQTPTFDWVDSSDSGSGVNHYEIEIYDWDITWGDISDTTTVSQYTPSENIPYDRIYWRVRAVDDVGNKSSWSTEWWLDIVEPKIIAIRWEYPAGNELPDEATKNVGDMVYIAVDTEYMRGTNATVYLYEDDGLFGSDDYIKSLSIPIPSDSDTGRIEWAVEWHLDTDFLSDLNPFQDVEPEYRIWRSTGLLETVSSRLIKINNPVTSLEWLDPEGNSLTELWVGDLVTLHVETIGLPEGTPITLDIFEDDVVFDDHLTQISATVQNDGTADAYWQVVYVEDGWASPEYYLSVAEYQFYSNDLDVYQPPESWISKFFAVAPWQIEEGSDVPVILGYHRICGFELFDIGIDRAIIELDGTALPAYDYDDIDDEYFTLPTEPYWYTMTSIPYDTYNSYINANNELPLSVTFNYAYDDSEDDGSQWAQKDTQIIDINVRFVNTIPNADRWPEWNSWYQGDTHWHSDITESNYAVPIGDIFIGFHTEYGTPLAIIRELADPLGLDWIAITDHSFDIDDEGAADTYRPLDDYHASGTLYSWNDLENDTAFGFADGFGFLKGEEISIDSLNYENPLYQLPFHQHHLLAYGFDSGDSCVIGGRGISLDVSNWGLGPEELRDLNDIFGGTNGVQDLGLFTYVAHPMLEDAVFGAPWTAPIVGMALTYQYNGQSVLRGFQFWNDRDAWDERDANLDLWEEVLSNYIMDSSQGKDEEFNWYLSGGSDDHLFYHLQGGTMTGDVRTVTYAPSLSDPNVLDALYYGRSFVTDGPWFAMGVDMNDDLDFMDFGFDIMMGGQAVITDPSKGILRFDWPLNQSGTDSSNWLWPDPAMSDIRLIHYNSNGDPNEPVLGTEKYWDAYADWLANRADYGDGWQCYRAELTLGDYKAYTNPIWLYFEINTPPTASNNTVTTVEDTDYVFAAGDFNFSDVDGDSLNKIMITTLETVGSLKLSGFDVTLNHEISVSDIPNLTFTPVADENGTGYDSFGFKVHDGTEYSVSAYTITIDITPVNDAPVLDDIEGMPLSYTENDGPVAITSTITVSDVDDTDMESAVIRITSNYQNGQDILAFTDTAGISGSWDATMGTLTLTGTDTLANYEVALRSITYENTSDNPSILTRTVSFTVNDGDTDSNTQSRDITITAVNDSIIYVDDDATTGANNGTTWDDAFIYLQDALNFAEASGGQVSEIWVAQGVYKPDQGAAVVSGDRYASFQLLNGVAVIGGYAGLGAPDPNARDVILYKTVLSGDLNGDDGPGFANYGENSYHVVTGSGTDATAVLDGFTITSGNATGSVAFANDSGGGVYCLGGSPMLIDNTFSANLAKRGGGMFTYSSNSTLINCTFSGNAAVHDGGGMYNILSTPTLIDSTFNGNYAGEFGGGMCNLYYSSPTLENTTFNGNVAKYGGGMANNLYSSPTLNDCAFIGNIAIYFGGGMCNLNYSSPTLINCTFIGNFAIYFGGGMHNQTGSSPDLTSCTFNGNSANKFGGGISNFQNSSPTLTNSIFSGNSAEYGGGMFNYLSSNPTLTNCTFSGNFAAFYGGGMFNISSNPTITNSIFWLNEDSGGTNESAQIFGGTPVINYSCIQGWTGSLGGTGNIGDDPLFVRNPDDGGDGWGVGGNDDYGDLRLSSGSPCIDAGDNTSVPLDVYDIDGDGNTTERIPWDLDGISRFKDDLLTVDTGVPDLPDYPYIVDMGAYEYHI